MAQLGYRGALQLDGACVGRDLAGDDLEQARFGCPVGADQVATLARSPTSKETPCSLRLKVDLQPRG